MTKHSTSLETLAAQGLGEIDPISGGLVPSIQPSTTYERDKDLSYDTYKRIYGRPSNPTVEPVERLMASLDKGRQSLLFASGMAASTAVMMALRPGDHVIASRIMYWAMRAWLESHGKDWGLQVDFMEGLSLSELRAKLRPGETRLVWLESPVNPTWDVIDIEKAAKNIHAAGARLAIDNSVATPVLSQPLTLGADIVMHSATKYLSGHSDLMGGVLTTPEDTDFWQRIKSVRHQYGGIIGPFEAWLLHRSLRTLFVRVRHQSASALKIAQHFANHSEVEAVLYPGLANHPGHTVAARQMQGGFGGMLSFLIQGGEERSIAVAARTQLFKRATSFGGTESLIEHRASMEGEGTPCPANLLRLSIGLETVEDLIADLEQALKG